MFLMKTYVEIVQRDLESVIYFVRASKTRHKHQYDARITQQSSSISGRVELHLDT